MASLTTPSVEFDSTAFFEQLPERHRPEPVAGPVHGEAHRQRRQALARAVAARSNGRPAVILAFSGKEILRNRDNPYAFRFNSDFFYLTGFPEPDAWLVIRVDAHDYT